MSDYIPPLGNLANLTFIGDYSPPLGNVVDLDLSKIIKYGYLTATTDSVNSDITCHHYIWEKTLTLHSITDSVTLDFNVKINDGLWYTTPTTVTFNFLDARYLISNGNHVPFIFSPINVPVKFVTFSSTTHVTSEFQLLGTPGDHTKGILSATTDVTVEFLILPNDGLWYTIPISSVIFAFLDSAYTVPGTTALPFAFTPLTTQPALFKLKIVTDSVTIQLSVQVYATNDSLLTYTLPTTGLFTCFFARRSDLIWLSSLSSILSTIIGKFIALRTGVLAGTTLTPTSLIQIKVPIPITATLSSTVSTNIFVYINGLVPIRITATLARVLANVTSAISLSKWDHVQGAIAFNTKNCSVIFNLYRAPVGNWLSTTANSTDLFNAIHLVGRLNITLATTTSIFRTVHLVGILDSNTNCIFYLTGKVPIRIYLTITLVTGTVIWIPLKELVAEFSIDYSIDGSNSVEHIQDISYFGEARNLFDNSHSLSYFLDAPNDLPIVQNLDYSCNLSRLNLVTQLEYVLEGLADEHNYVLQQYSANLKDLAIFEILEYLVEIAVDNDNSISNSYSNILLAAGYTNEISSSIIVEEQTNEAHFYWDLDTINLYQDSYSVNYEIQSPTTAVINIIPDTPVAIIRLLASLSAVLQSSTSSIIIEIFLHIVEPRNITLSFITDDSLFYNKGYSVLRLTLDVQIHDDYVLFTAVTIYGSLFANTGNILRAIRGYTLLTLTANLITDKSNLLSPPTTGHFLLTAASTYFVYADMNTGSICVNIFGVGASVGSLYVSGNPNESYNITDPITHKILRYWYALGVIFNGMIINPYALRTEIITPIVVCRFIALIPEPVYLTLASSLNSIIFNGKGFIRVTLNFNVVLDNISCRLELGYTNTYIQMDLIFNNVGKNLILKTPIRIYVDFRANTNNSHSDIIIRLANLGKIQSSTPDAISLMWAVQVVGTLECLLDDVLNLLELRIPFGITFAGDTGYPTGEINLKVPIAITVRFDCAFDNALGGFRLRNPSVGTLESITAFMLPKILISSITGRLATVTNNNIHADFYIVNRDAQIFDLDLNSEDCSSKFKTRITTYVRVNLSMSDNYSIITMKAPIHNILDFRTSTVRIIPTFVLRNGKATFIVIEHFLPDAISQIYLYHPLIGFFNITLNDIFLNCEIKVPEKYLLDFTPDIETALANIRGGIPVLGYIDCFIGNDTGYFRVSHIMGSMYIYPPVIQRVEFKLSVALRISVTISRILDNISFRVNGRVETVGTFIAITVSEYKEEDSEFDHSLMPSQQQKSGVKSLFRLFTYILPTAISGRLLSSASIVIPNFVLNNPTNGLRFNIHVTAFGNINLVSLIQFEFVIETEGLRICEIALNLKATSGIIISECTESLSQ